MPTLPGGMMCCCFFPARIKTEKLIQSGAAQARANGARVFSLTDSNDRELVEGSDLGILVPSLVELPAATMTLFVLEWLAMEIQRAGKT